MIQDFSFAQLFGLTFTAIALLVWSVIIIYTSKQP